MSDYLYIAFRSGGFKVIDWTDVSAMLEVAQTTSGQSWAGWSGVFEKSGLLYCAAMHADFFASDNTGIFAGIYDVTDPTIPVFKSDKKLIDSMGGGSNFPMDQCESYVFVAGNGNTYFCVLDRNGIPGMRVLNVTDPLNPIFIKYFPGQGETGGIFSNGIIWSGFHYAAGILYVSDWSGLQAFDFLNDPENPVHIASFGGGQYEGMAVIGNSIYVGNKASGLTLFDISTPGVPIKVKDFTQAGLGMNGASGEYAAELAIAGTTLITVTQPRSISWVRLYDITDTQNIVNKGATDFNTLLPGSEQKHAGLAIKDGYVVHSAGSFGLVVIDINNVSSPSPASFSPFTLSGASDPYFAPWGMSGGVPGIVNPSVTTVPAKRYYEVKTRLWRGFGLETAEIVRMNVDKMKGNFYRIRRFEKSLQDGTTRVELVAHIPKKVAYLTSGLIGLSGGWDITDSPEDVEASGYWYGENEITAGYNDKFVFSLDGGVTYNTATMTAGVFSNFSTLATMVMNAINGFFPGRVISVQRSSAYKVQISLSIVLLRITTQSTVPVGVTESDYMAHVRFMSQILGMTPETMLDAVTVTFEFQSPVLYDFDADYGTMLDVSRYG